MRPPVIKVIPINFNYANRFVAQIEHQTVKLDLEPFQKQLQVTLLRPCGFVRPPSFQLFFEENVIAGLRNSS
jgi:hypothetical protein